MAKRDQKTISYAMSRIRGKNTGIELALRKALSEEGVHYRLYSSSVFGHPDICLKRLKIAIFCDSEFWHGYHFEENKSKIHSNLSYWIPKIERNIARDKEVNEALTRQGYLVLRYWGKEIEKELPRVKGEILDAIKKREELFSRIKGIKAKTTLAYIERDDSYLLLHRNKKEKDPNEGKWIGIGGKIEEGESYVHAFKREIKEETGLDVLSYSYLGKIAFLNDSYPDEMMFLFKVTSFFGRQIECDEGELAWVKKNEMANLDMWEGDKAFLPLLEQEAPSPFTLCLLYHKQELCRIDGPFYHCERKKKAKRRKRK
jgi:DNA mismatch endonuclease Vsr